MIEGIPKISVLVITYKQEDIVGRTLDSLVSQRDYLYEICISDDCSPDGTWDVLLDYQKRYPDLIKLHRQEHNVGIFENNEYSWKMPTGDIINEIAGDDTTPDGWYKTVVNYIIENNIDYKNELFCIFGDYMALYPNGDYFILNNHNVASGADVFSMAMRNVITGRGCCFSMGVHKKRIFVSQGRSHIVERTQDNQVYFFMKKIYYIPSLANVYYTGIGVSKQITEEEFKERINIPQYSRTFFEKLGHVYTKKDLNYMNFEKQMITYSHKKKISSLVKALYYYIVSVDFKIPGKGIFIKRIYFAIIRRLPHSKPIKMYI